MFKNYQKEVNAMKTDARVIHTKATIREDFIALLNDHPLNKITVKALCDKANINRATFYRYYEDIYDLYEKIKDEFISAFLDSFFDMKNLTTENKLKIFVHEIKKNSSLVYALTKQNDSINFTSKMCCKLYHHIENEFNALFSDFNEKQCSSAFIFVVSGCTGLISAWVNSGMKASTDEVASTLYKLIKNTLNFA